MKPDDILDAIGLVEDACVKKTKEKKKSRKNIWITVSTIAACFVLFMLIPNIPNFIGYSAAGPEDGNEMATVKGNVWIYYVDDDAISREQEFLPYISQDIFVAWKEKNGIGQEVVLVDVKIESNGEPIIRGDVVEYQVGDYFVYNIAVSANIENYYEIIDSELLLESLKQTMTGYSEIVYDEYHISFV